MTKLWTPSDLTPDRSKRPFVHYFRDPELARIAMAARMAELEMTRALYSVTTEGAVALSAATAKSAIGIKAAADFGLDLVTSHVALDGVTASAVPVQIQLLYATWATNSPGTNSTSTTPRQRNGRVTAHGISSAANWTSEPTALTIVDEVPLLTPAGGTVIYDFPLGTEPDSDLAQGFVIRCNAPASVNVRCLLGWARN